jgi:hypothetical protein
MARVADDLRADPKRRSGMAARSEREWERLFGAESCRCAATVGVQGFPTFAGDLICPLCVDRANGSNRPFAAYKIGPMNGREARGLLPLKDLGRLEIGVT